MSTSFSRTRALAVPLLLGFIGLVGSACAPEPPPYYGIIFNTPAIGYVGKTYTPTATATSGLAVSLALDASSTGCSFVGGVLSYGAPGSCVINATQAGDVNNVPFPSIQRTITIHECPPLRAGIWTGPLDLSANVFVNGSTFTGSVDLSSLGYGVQAFGGTVSCEVVNMTFNGTPLTGWLSWDGTTLSSNYSGIDIVLNAPAT